MKKIIDTVIQRNKPIFLTRKTLDSFITFELIYFIDSNSRHCEMLIGYNATNVYCVRSNMLSSRNGPIVDLINSSIKRWDTKEEYLNERIQLNDKTIFDKIGARFVQSIVDNILHISNDTYSCRDVVVTTNPVATLCVKYNKDKKRQYTLKAFLGDKFYIKYENESFRDFVEKCFSKYCEIEWIY